MHPTFLHRLRHLALAVALTLAATALHAQDPDSVRARITSLADSYVDTPAGMGLLETALTEGGIAAQHARLGAGDPTSLEGMRRHAGHVLHALDPTLVAGGPAMGYGVKRAAAEASRQLDLLLASDSLSENVSVHATHIAAALADVVQWTDEAIGVAESLQLASSVSDAAGLVTRLDDLCKAIRYGRDADGDRRVGWQRGESGLAQAVQHMNLLKRGEGLTR